jgi:hypothetical protein
MMIDNDTVPKSCLPELTQMGHYVVAARVPVYGGGWNVYHLDGMQFVQLNSITDTRSVDAVGTAAICIHRNVFDGIRETESLLPFWMAKYSVDGRLLLGEDILFCSRARDLGFIPHVAPGHDCGHMRTTDLARGTV